MRVNQAALCLLAFFTYMVMSGFLTQTGVILESVADALSISITEAGSLFSFLTGGTFVGTIISMWLYSNCSLKSVFRITYVILTILLLLMLMVKINNPVLFSIFLISIGTCCGVGLSGGAVVLSAIFRNEHHRASAFLATDCSFSFAGFIFPSAAALIIAAQFSWSFSYAVVGVLAICIFILSFVLKFPDTKAPPELAKNSPLVWISPRVFLMALGLCIYLISQTTFLTWAPQYLEQTFLIESQKAAGVIGNYWGMSIFGLIVATLLVAKLPTRIFLLSVCSIALILIWMLTLTNSADWFLTLTLVLGFCTSCIFKIGIAVGTLQIKNSPPILVTFLLCSATMGSTVAPALSSFIVDLSGTKSAMLMTAIGYSIVACLFAICIGLEYKGRNSVKRLDEC